MVYLSNEQHVDVFFDDLHVTHVRGRLMEEQHYYPHGLLINKTIAAGAIPENKYQFEGKKMQDEIGLKLYDFHARQYDPQIGRFWGIDPADQFPSGYTGIGNDPAYLTDPTGMQVGGGGSPLGIEASSDAEARKNYVDRGRRAEKFQLYVDGQFAGWENWENIPFIGVGTPTVDLLQGVTLTTKNVGGKTIQGYWRNTNRTDYTQSGLSTMDGKYTEMGLSIVALKFIPFGYKVQGQGNGSGNDWLQNTQTGLGAFDFAHGAKEELINYAAKSSLTINELNYVKAVKVVSKGLFAVQAGISVYQAGNAFYTNNSNKWGVAGKASLDITIGAISVWGGPIGWTIGGVYFIGDAAGWWGNWGQAAPSPIDINKR